MRIRSVTIGANVSYPVEAGPFRAFGQFAARARALFEDAGLEVQTVRLATQPFPEILREEGPAATVEWDALGIIESLSVTAGIVAADLAAKEADVQIPEIRLAGGMGGKSTIKVMGTLENVQASLSVGADYVRERGLLCRQVLIPRPHPDVWEHLLKARPEVDEIWK